nr:MAG: DUF4351 domain-containing protein [Leptolyngbya sp. IPPAS B-1204]
MEFLQIREHHPVGVLPLESGSKEGERSHQRSQVEALSLEEMEELVEALLDFAGLDDLQSWLTQQN